MLDLVVKTIFCQTLQNRLILAVSTRLRARAYMRALMVLVVGAVLFCSYYSSNVSYNSFQ